MQISKSDVVPSALNPTFVTEFENKLGFGNQNVLNTFREQYNCYQYGEWLCWSRMFKPVRFL